MRAEGRESGARSAASAWKGTLALLALALVLAGCRQDMHDQPKVRTYRGSALFADGRGMRPLVAGTVARGHLDEDVALTSGRVGDAFVSELPLVVNEELVRRGRERYDIYCAPCHGRTGAGDGMIVRRGYRKPTSYHTDRLRAVPVGYLFDVITHGFGVMPDYAAQVSVHDRWAISLYVRALQLSQHGTMADVPEQQREQLSDANE